MTSPLPPILERVVALRGFAWIDEVPTGALVDAGTPVLGQDASHVGHVATAAEETDPYTVFRAIAPLQPDDRRRLLLELEAAERELLGAFMARADQSRVAWLDAESGSADALVEDDADAPPGNESADAEVEAQGQRDVLEDRRQRAIRARTLAKAVLQDRVGQTQDMEVVASSILQIREQLFADSIRLAVTWARKRAPTLAWEYATMAACLGVAKAIDRFEPARGNEFSTMAVWWIRQSVERAGHNHGMALRVPVYAQQILSRFVAVEKAMWAQRGSRPAAQDVAGACGLGSTNGIAELRRTALRAFIGGWTGLGERVLDPCIPSPADGGLPDGWVSLFESVVERLCEQAAARVAGGRDEQKARALDILWSRLGWGRTDAETLEQIGQRHGLSRERIRQVETRLLAELQTRSVARMGHPVIAPWDWVGGDE